MRRPPGERSRSQRLAPPARIATASAGNKKVRTVGGSPPAASPALLGLKTGSRGSSGLCSETRAIVTPAPRLATRIGTEADPARGPSVPDIRHERDQRPSRPRAPTRPTSSSAISRWLTTCSRRRSAAQRGSKTRTATQSSRPACLASPLASRRQRSDARRPPDDRRASRLESRIRFRAVPSPDRLAPYNARKPEVLICSYRS